MHRRAWAIRLISFGALNALLTFVLFPRFFANLELFLPVYALMSIALILVLRRVERRLRSKFPRLSKLRREEELSIKLALYVLVPTFILRLGGSLILTYFFRQNSELSSFAMAVLFALVAYLFELIPLKN